MNTTHLAAIGVWMISAATMTNFAVAQESTSEENQGILEQYEAAKVKAANHAQEHIDQIKLLWADLADMGITLNGSITIDSAQNWQGGLSTNGSSLAHLLEIGLTFDLETIASIENASVYFAFQNQHGSFASEDAGDIQETSDILGDGLTQISELWYQQTYADGQIRLLIGKRDLNEEFAYSDYGSTFQNTSFDQSPTIFVMPTYPDPSTGALVFLNPSQDDLKDTQTYIGIGVFDGALQEDIRTGSRGPSTLYDDPADLFIIGELGITWGNTNDQELPGRFAIGGWGHTGTFAQFSGGDEDGTEGLYLILDQLVHRENPDDPDNDQGIGVFLQYGWADEDVSEIEHHVGFGLQTIGLFEGRDQDIAGLGVTYVHLSDDAGFESDEEITIEVYQQTQLAPFLTFQNDLQYIINPGGSDRKDALVSTTRAVIEF